MKILVLGGNGFIGSHVVDELLDAGHAVRVFRRRHEVWRKPLPSVNFFWGDFSNMPMLAEALQGVDAVLHLISTTVPSTSNLDPIENIQSNPENSVRFFQLMVSVNVKRIIFLSSGGTVYGIPSTIPVHENHPLNPICSYGVVKVAIEKYLGMFEQLYGLKPLIIRASNPFGPAKVTKVSKGWYPLLCKKYSQVRKLQFGEMAVRSKTTCMLQIWPNSVVWQPNLN